MGFAWSARPWAEVVEALESRLLLDGGAQWVDFNLLDSPQSGVSPQLDVHCSTPQEFSAELKVSGIWVDTVKQGDGAYAALSLPDTGFSDDLGLPQLPVVRRILDVADGATVQIESHGASAEHALSDLGTFDNVLPLQPQVPKVDGMAPPAFVLDSAAYSADSFTPSDTVRVVDLGRASGKHEVLLEIAPVQYDPATRQLDIYTDLNVDVQFVGGQVGTASEDIGTTSGQRLLIIAHDSLATAPSLQAFISQKQADGWTVDLANTSTAGTTTTAIQAYIKGRYNNVATRPNALLLVGDSNLIPRFVSAEEDNPDTDLYYTTMDGGDDWQPEFPVGRFSVTTTAQLDAVVNKTIYYETQSAGAWTNQAAFVATDDSTNWSLAEGTHNYVISTYMDPRGYISDKLYAHTYGATTAQVSAAVNDGQALLVYSGHGSETEWAGPEFSQSNVNALTNANMYPFVLSFACLTGEFSQPECFAETWQRAANKGAVDMLASSVYSYWDPDDILEKKLFEAIYGEGITRFGDAVNRAKQLYLEYWGLGGGGSTTRRYFEMYNIFGDPTVQLTNQQLGIISTSPLPTAYQNEDYDQTLQAGGGTAPYSWSITNGALPTGLAMDAAGHITGTPPAKGTAAFTAQVRDAANATFSRQFQLPVVTRMTVVTASPLPAATLNTPYSVTLVAQGGTSPYAWSVAADGTYAENATIPSGWLGQGTAQGWRANDQSWSLSLPWAFPFYGTNYTSVHVCSNGFLDFASSATDYGNTDDLLKQNVRIAPLWEDLVTSGPGEDIFVTSTSGYVAIRWQAETYDYFDNGVPVNFEAVLYHDGTIRFNYGAAQSGISATIGISKGDGKSFTLSSRDNATDIPSYVSSDFTWQSPLPPGLSLGSAGVLSGTPTALGSYTISTRVTDSGSPPQTVLRDFALSVASLPPLAIAAPASFTEGDGLRVGAGTVSLPAASPTSVTVNLVSSDTSELLVPASVTFPPNTTTMPFDITVVDDALLDGPQDLTITASGSGYTAGVANVRVYDNESSSLSVTLPPTAREGDGKLTAAGLITAAAAPDAPITVTLTSSDTTEATVPATVVLPMGQKTVAFDMTIIDDTIIDDTQTVTITASIPGWAGGAASMQVLDNDRTMGLVLPALQSEGAGVVANAGRLVLGGTALTAIVVNLSSTDTSELTVPPTVTVPAGQSFVNFDLTSVDDAICDGSQTVTVAATSAGFPDAIGTIVITDDDAYQYDYAPIAGPQVDGRGFQVTITAEDINGETITDYTGSVQLTASGDHGPVPLQVSAKTAGAPADGAVEVTPKMPASTKGLGVYHTYADLTGELNAYAASYPSICQLYSIGQSAEGRELWAMKITDHPAVEEDEPEFLYVSSLHGDENLGVEMDLYFIDYLLTNYGTDARVTSLVNNTELWVIPMINPDGVTLDTRENADGVDLNRDFPEGSAPNDIGDVLDGPAMDTAGRAPETVALMNFSAAHRFVASANFHTGALVVNYPYDEDGKGNVDSPTPDDALFEYIAQVYSQYNLPMWNSTTFTHGITNGAAWYTVDGGLQDWSYRYLGDNDVTIELSDTQQPSADQLPAYWDDNRDSMLAYAETAQMGLQGIVTDAATGLPLSAKILVSGDSQPVFTDPDLGDYHRMLLPGTYSLIISAPGHATRTISNVVVTADGAAVANAALDPINGVSFSNGVWTGTVAVTQADTHVQLTASDAAGHASASGAFDVVEPLAMAMAGDLPLAVVNKPYPLTLRTSGGASPMTWWMLGAGSYTESSPPPMWLGGGAAMNWQADDQSWSLSLPWAFGYYGQSYTSVNVCSNGFLNFTSIATAYDNSAAALRSAVRIAPLWDNLRTDGSGDDIFVTSSTDYVAVRWQAHTYNGGSAVNFEAVLYRSGAIAFDYLGTNAALTPTIGLSAGNGADYTLSTRDAAPAISSALSVFAYQPALPTGVSLSSSGVLSGTPTAVGTYSFSAGVTDSASPAQWVSRTFTIRVVDSAAFTGTAGADVYTMRLDDSGQAMQLYGSGPAPVFSVLRTLDSTVGVDMLTGDDRLTVDFSRGNPIPAGGINLTADAGDNDELILSGIGPEDSLTIRSDGVVFGTSLINCTGIETTTLAGSDLLRLASLAIDSGGKLRLTPGGRPLEVNSFSLDPAGQLDLCNRSLIIHASGAARQTLLDTLIARIASAHNTSPLWQGLGLTSSVACNRADGLTGLAAIINEDETGHTITDYLDGEPVTADRVLVKYTYNGDSDLNGIVDADDYFRIDQGYRLQADPQRRGYRYGDIDYQNGIAADDFYLIDQAFVRQGAPIVSFAAAKVSGIVQAVLGLSV